MIIRSMFGLGLVAIFGIISLFVPAPFLPQQQAMDFFSAQIEASLSDYRSFDPDEAAPAGWAVVWNAAGAPVLSADLTWPSGSQGGMRADGEPLAKNDSLCFDLGLDDVQTVDVAVQCGNETLCRTFTFDFSSKALVVGVYDDGTGGYTLALYQGDRP